jgi:hypothetical protein
MQRSDSAARDVGRDANVVIADLIERAKGWHIDLTEIGSPADVDDKIDGFFTTGPDAKRSVQLSCRTGTSAHDDFAIQIVSKRPDVETLYSNSLDALMDRFPAKLQSPAQIHVVLNADGTAIYLANADMIRPFVQLAVTKMKQEIGRFAPQRHSFREPSGGGELRVSESREGWSVLAYVPAERVKYEKIAVTKEQVDDARARAKAVIR